jgi:hypothetical protein
MKKVVGGMKIGDRTVTKLGDTLREMDMNRDSLNAANTILSTYIRGHYIDNKDTMIELLKRILAMPAREQLLVFTHAFMLHETISLALQDLYAIYIDLVISLSVKQGKNIFLQYSFNSDTPIQSLQNLLQIDITTGLASAGVDVTALKDRFHVLCAGTNDMYSLYENAPNLVNMASTDAVTASLGDLLVALVDRILALESNIVAIEQEYVKHAQVINEITKLLVDASTLLD